MKGDKIYKLALEVYQKLTDNADQLDKQDKSLLYNQYFELLKKSAYQGHVSSMFDMGQQYEDVSYLGAPNPLHHPKKCFFWYTKASDKGHAEACNNLAIAYERGEGCDRDLSKALNLYKQSAELGSKTGKKNYKVMIKNMLDGGRYGKQDQTKD